MKIEKYGIVLEKLNPERLELLRKWRNSPEINRHMEYKEYITAVMQQAWFKKIDNEQNFFFIIIFDEKPIGMIHISEIDWDKGEAQCGLFIGEKKYLNTNIPVSASLTLLDVFFEILNIKKIFAKTHRENLPAISYNQSLGFLLAEESTKTRFDTYYLTKEHYFSQTERIRKIASSIFDSHSKVILSKKNHPTIISKRLNSLNTEKLKQQLTEIIIED